MKSLSLGRQFRSACLKLVTGESKSGERHGRRVEKMITMVDSAGGTVIEKEEAKSLLRKLAENKIVQSVFGAVVKTWSGG